jgi:hypothetical protein
VFCEPHLEEAVLFELPTTRHAQGLLKVVGDERFAWQQPVFGAAVVTVALTGDELDLAFLLRRVQNWARHAGLDFLRFEVDGRVYVADAKKQRAKRAA